MSGLIYLLNGIAVTVFGSILAVSFCTEERSAKNRRVFFFSIAAVLVLQGGLSFFLEMQLLKQLYPFTMHLPLVLMLYFMTGRKLWPVVSVLTAYLCCQLRRWLALAVTAAFSGDGVMQAAAELGITLPLLLLLLRFVSPAVRRLALLHYTEQWQFGIIPVLYYVFDYSTMVYTGLLLGSGAVVVEFMPFVCCGAYLVFLLYHSVGERRRVSLMEAQKNLDIQLKQSVREISTLRESQELARRYRHDLRHHLQYVSSCIGNGKPEQAQAYIGSIFREIEAVKSEQFCENEAANLIFSSFAGRAKKEGITMNVRGAIPSDISVSDSDLCVLLSNALENALNACMEISSEKSPVIDVQFYMRDGKLFLQVTNPCEKEVRFEKGLPLSDRPDHGVGVQSICTIVERYGGVYSFSLKESLFILRLSV